MNITFMIGNGLDMRFGLKTSYKTIEENYVATASANKNIADFKQSMDGDKDYWSYFETAMGEYTNKFDDDQQAQYKECIRDFTAYLVNYLSSEEEKVDLSPFEKVIKENFREYVSNFYMELPQRYREDVRKVIVGKQELVSYHFISFYYTHIFDKCVEMSFDKDEAFEAHRIGTSAYSHILRKNVLHIHGELPGPIVMGVNDESQIAKESWRQSQRFLEGYVKPATNVRLGTMRDELAKNVLDNSGVVCIWGMSLGSTDKMWWAKLGTWLAQGNRRLIIFSHQDEEGFSNAMADDIFEVENTVKDQFLDVAGVSNDKRAELEKKIYVIINTKHIKLKFIDEKSEDKPVSEEISA